MEIGYHKLRAGQDIIWKGAFCCLILFLLQCSSARPYQLTDASPRFKEFQGTDIDPLKGKKSAVKLSNNKTYDDFILTAKKNVTTLEFAENVVMKADAKRSLGEEIKAEMAAAAYLEEDLPEIVNSIQSLQKRNLELMNTAPNYFDGPSLGRVSGELGDILKKLNEYAPKAQAIQTSVKNLRSDSNNYPKTNETVVQEPKKDPEIQKTEVVETKEPVIVANQKDIKDVKSNKDELQIKRLERKAKVTGTAKDLFKEQIKQEEEVLTEEEKRDKEYTEQVRKGLVQVFQWEHFKKPKNLEKLLLTYPIPRVRSAAALALGRLKAGRGALQTAIDKDGYQVRPAAYKALADIGDKKSLSYFISGTKAEDPEVIAASFEGLGKTKDPAGRELILTQGLNSEYVIIVAASLRGLAYNRIPADVEVMEKFLKSSEDEEIKEAAIEALSIHGSKEGLRILETNVKEQPALALKILDEIGKNPSLSATFSLIRLNESLEDEKLTKRIGEHLLRKKAFGRYAVIQIEDDFLRSEANERSKAVSYIKQNEIGLVIGESKKEFAVRMGENIVTDKYINVKMESTLPGSGNAYVSGWIFYPKLEIIEVKKLGGPDEGKYSNINKGKHQNLFNPSETEKRKSKKEESN